MFAVEDMAHLLRYGAAVHTSLIRANPQHSFAHTFAIHLYDSNAIYSMIPKNGCTTMRVSIARANGIISDAADWEWIHLNNDSFRPSLRDLATANYRFTILRCPYGRLVSCFLDKFVKRTPDSAQFITATKNSIDLETLTFRRFCEEIAKPSILRSNMHWRPQVDFLVYATYDDYFCFEAFSSIQPLLNSRIGLKLIDARPLAKHDLSHYKMVHATHSFADTPLAQVEAMLLNGFYPKPESFYDDELYKLIGNTYKSDFELYRWKCPGMGIMSDQLTLDPWFTAV